MSEREFNNAWDYLQENNIITKVSRQGKEFLFNKQKESHMIDTILDTPLSPEEDKDLRPDEMDSYDLVEIFDKMEKTKFGPRHYYYYVEQADLTHWWLLFKTSPDKKCTRRDMGSLRDRKSRISRMWDAMVQIRDKHDQPISGKLIADEDPVVFKRNSWAVMAGFEIFLKFKWIKEISSERDGPLYQITDDKSYHKLVARKLPVCLECGMTMTDSRCLNPRCPSNNRH